MTKPRAVKSLSNLLPAQPLRHHFLNLLDGLRREFGCASGVTVGSLQVTCSKLGVSLRRSRMRFPSYERLKPELELSQAGSEAGLVEKGSLLKVKIAVTIQRGDLLRTLDVSLSIKAMGELALLASLRKVGLVDLIAQILSGVVDKGLVEKILNGNDIPPKA